MSEVKRERAFRRLTTEMVQYLKSIGWTAIVAGPIRVQQQPEEVLRSGPDGAFGNHELVIQFMGGRIIPRENTSKRRLPARRRP